MEVTVLWTEAVDYESTITVDTDSEEFKEWSGGAPITPELIKDYLQSGDESGWFEQCDTHTDFVAVSERTLDSVMLG